MQGGNNREVCFVEPENYQYYLILSQGDGKDDSLCSGVVLNVKKRAELSRFFVDNCYISIIIKEK